MNEVPSVAANKTESNTCRNCCPGSSWSRPLSLAVIIVVVVVVVVVVLPAANRAKWCMNRHPTCSSSRHCRRKDSPLRQKDRIHRLAFYEQSWSRHRRSHPQSDRNSRRPHPGRIHLAFDEEKQSHTPRHRHRNSRRPHPDRIRLAFYEQSDEQSWSRSSPRRRRHHKHRERTCDEQGWGSPSDQRELPLAAQG